VTTSNGHPAACVMVCGTSSGAGKSLLTTALARYYARRGLKVAPFKAQNMSNNARVVEEGEMASAQYFQALAAGCTPNVRMNPVLLKPEGDTRSQVILLGRRDERLSQMEWRERSEHLWPTVLECLEDLRGQNDVLVIEGAGSPAEINLQASDVVNMRVATAAAAATVLICDIDRGGAFAHLYGTYQLLSPEHRRLIRGFVLNKFRGDARLLAPGPERLAELTGVPTIGVLPMWREHGLSEEDGVFDAPSRSAGLSVVIVSYPRISNLDEFNALKSLPGISLTWGRDAGAIAGADLLVLPGSKHVANDLAWLHSRGMTDEIKRHTGAGKPTLAVCGGLQMLGEDVRDPGNVEGATRGLGLLPLATTLEPEKCYDRACYQFLALDGFWAPLTGLTYEGYEIRHGRTVTSPASDAGGLRPVLPANRGWQRGSILGLYTHGMFENASVLQALFGSRTRSHEATFEGLADFIEDHIGKRALLGLLQRP
jgi:adenosylcobyric acid synthase